MRLARINVSLPIPLPRLMQLPDDSSRSGAHPEVHVERSPFALCLGLDTGEELAAAANQRRPQCPQEVVELIARAAINVKDHAPRAARILHRKHLH